MTNLLKAVTLVLGSVLVGACAVAFTGEDAGESSSLAGRSLGVHEEAATLLPKAPIPSIDAMAPSEIKTATFALG